VLSGQGKLQQSVQVFDQVIELRPDYAEAYCNRGNVLRDLGQQGEAVKSYDKAIELRPDFAGAYFNRGRALGDLGQLAEAAASFNKILELDPDDERYGARLQLARLGEEEIPDSTPKAYMKNFYRLKSRVWGGQSGAQDRWQQLWHQMVRETIECEIQREDKFDILDLGCGTGVLADFLSFYARRLDGVDISPDMLKRSAERGIYDNLLEEDLVQYLQGTSYSYGLVVAAAVLIHFADLETIFSLVWNRLNENGKFVFSLYQAAEKGVELNSFNMYAHSDQYIKQLAYRTGFRLCYQKEDVHEYHGKHAVMGAVYLLEKQSRS
jgi:predicted TPR repeat methyltransferase